VVIVVLNHKGGTGKTTTCVNLGAALAASGHRVLLVDLDPQASASLYLGLSFQELEPSLAAVLFDRLPLTAVRRQTSVPRLELVTGGLELAHSDLVLAAVPGREDRLAAALEPVRNEFDFILCDCPPSLSLLPVNALQAGDRYLVALTPDYLALEGLITALDTVDRMREGLGTGIDLLGILFTRVRPAGFPLLGRELRYQREVIRLVREEYGQQVFQTVIHEDPRLAAAPAYGLTILQYAPGSRGARDYTRLAAEVAARCNLQTAKRRLETWAAG